MGSNSEAEFADLLLGEMADTGMLRGLWLEFDEMKLYIAWQQLGDGKVK